MRRRAKIIATIGPASSSMKVLRQLIQAGMDVARLNFSHGTHDEHAVVIERVRKVAKQAGRSLTSPTPISRSSLKVKLMS